MRFLTLLLVTMCANSFLNAAVVEQTLTLPNELGNAVMYHDTKATKPAPAVVVVHEWWGLNDYARKRAHQLAKLGYTAIAVDMYGTGKSTSHPKDAMSFMNAALAEPEKMNARFDAALGILRKQPFTDSSKLFAIGYCFGGAVVLNQARRGLDLAGVASFHGSLGTKTKVEPGTIKAKVLVATGGADAMVPVKQVAGFVEEMTAANVNFELLSFPGVMHSFTNPGSTALGKKYDMPLAYDAHADQVSWAALMTMLAQ
jgi:dienelactone hydrolase